MAAAAGPKPGILAACYRNSGTYGSPTWSEVTLIRDSNIAAPWDLGDSSIRATRAKLQEKTQIALSGQINVRADDADTAYQALLAAAMAAGSSGIIDMMLLDGDIASEGAAGFRAHWNLNFSGQNQEIGGVIYTPFDLSPAYHSSGYPSKVLMGSDSAPSFTAF